MTGKKICHPIASEIVSVKGPNGKFVFNDQVFALPVYIKPSHLWILSDQSKDHCVKMIFKTRSRCRSEQNKTEKINF